MAKQKFPLPPEYWQIQCPHCLGITYYKVTNPVEECFLPYRRWPILKCKCGKYYSKEKSELLIFTTCEKVEPRPLVVRQAVPIELEVKEKANETL